MKYVPYSHSCGTFLSMGLSIELSSGCRGDSEAKPDYECVASAVFSGPPLCVVGLSEEEARDKYGDIDVYTSSFK